MILSASMLWLKNNSQNDFLNPLTSFSMFCWYCLLRCFDSRITHKMIFWIQWQVFLARKANRRSNLKSKTICWERWSETSLMKGLILNAYWLLKLTQGETRLALLWLKRSLVRIVIFNKFSSMVSPEVCWKKVFSLWRKLFSVLYA